MASKNGRSHDQTGIEKGRNTPKGSLICKYCNAIFEGKHWRKFADLKVAFIDRIHSAVCPACHEEQNHLSDGIVKLSGTIMPAKRTEILNEINNAEKTAQSRNVLDRVERVEDSGKNEITVYTTNNQLAVQIGKKIASAHKGGKLEIKWSKNEKAVEVRWHKDLTK